MNGASSFAESGLHGEAKDNNNIIVAQGDSGGTSGSPSRKDEYGSSNGAD